MPAKQDTEMDLIIPSDVTAADAGDARQCALTTLTSAKDEGCRLRIDLSEGKPTAIALQLLIASMKSAASEGRLGELGPGATAALANASGILDGDDAT
jgi:hypothetical protein